MRKTLKRLDKRARHYTDHILLSILTTIDEDMPAPVHARKQYRKGLLAERDQLQRDRDTIDARIAFLENMTEDDIEDLPYHHIWQDKHVSFEEIYQRLKKHPDLQHVCNFDDMRSVYHSSVRCLNALRCLSMCLSASIYFCIYHLSICLSICHSSVRYALSAYRF